jgi:hypothetical protein
MKKTTFFLFILMAIPLWTNILAQELLLFGGENHKQFLGCLNCGSYDSNSIWNEYGTYGSSYSQNSIWNEYGTYGSEYSSYSPWNEYANNPPVVVDHEGNFYGYLTINAYHDKRAEFRIAKILYQYYDLIREEPEKWYEKIFN